MRYVGYSRGFHDGGLAIIEEDGTVSYASNSERFTKIKYDATLAPELESMIKNDDYLVFYQDLKTSSQKYYNELRDMPKVFSMEDTSGKSMLFKRDNMNFSFEELLYNHIEDSGLPFHMHHESHVAGALYTRPWKSKDDTVMVSIDGVGEEQSAVIYDSNFNVKFEHCAPQSIGWLYGLSTTLLGHKRLRDEYIVMGMSAHGEPNDNVVKLIKDFYNSFDLVPPEQLRMMRNTFNNTQINNIKNTINTHGTNTKMEQDRRMFLLGSPNMTFDMVNDFFQKYVQYVNELSAFDIAASIQKFTEDKIYEIMVHARQYGSKLVYSGGVAQNIVVNSKIRDLFDEMHIAIAPTDGGSALGCASKSWSEQTGGTHLKWSPYLGYNIKRDVNPKKVVDYLMKNKVCGIANGRAEFGPRALGNRSLLGDVRYDIKDTVNKIKQRELYRPFAPAILEEYADEYFDGYKNEYMQYQSIAKHDYKSVIHVDGTSRCQVVKKDCQSVIRPILEEYFERTGIPMLLNTSLNIKGQPILNDERDVEEWEKKYKVRIF